MNIQMPSLGDGTPSGDGSPPAACLLAMATAGSTTDHQERKEIHPQYRHKVPVQRRRLVRPQRQYAGGHPPLDVCETTEAAQHVRAMKRGKYVEESAARPGRQNLLLCDELPPCQNLTDEEQQSQPDSDMQAEGGVPAAGRFQYHAAGEQHERVDVEQRRQLEMMPIWRSALAHDERARERGERHRNRADPDPHARVGDVTVAAGAHWRHRHLRRQDGSAHPDSACMRQSRPPGPPPPYSSGPSVTTGLWPPN